MSVKAIATINELKNQLEAVEYMIANRKSLGYKMAAVKESIVLAINTTAGCIDGSSKGETTANFNYTSAKLKLDRAASCRSWHVLENFFVEALGRLELALDAVAVAAEVPAQDDKPEAECLTGALTTAELAVSYKLDIDGHTERNDYSAEMIEEMVEKVDHVVFNEVYDEGLLGEQTGWEYYGFNDKPEVAELLAGLMDKVEAKRLLNLRMIRAGVREVAKDMNKGEVEPVEEVSEAERDRRMAQYCKDNGITYITMGETGLVNGEDLLEEPEVELEVEQETKLEQAVEAMTYIEERDAVEMELMEADMAEMEQGVVSSQQQQVETPVTVEPVEETPETPEKQLPSYYVEVVVGSLWYYIAYTAALGFYWSPDKKDAHSFTYDEAKEYQRNDTNCGQTFIQVLDDGETVETEAFVSVPEPETRVETPLETVDTASDSKLHLVPIKCAVWELSSMAYDKQKTHKDMLNRLQWHRYDFRELGGAVAKLWDELITKVYNASRRCRAVAIMAKYQVLLQSELETMGVSWTTASSGMEA